MIRRVILGLAWCTVVTALPDVTFAQVGVWSNYRPVLLGGRTAAMGGTGVAFGTDSAMPVLNPAGLAAIDKHNISLSASLYSLSAVDVKDYYSGSDEPIDPLFANQITEEPDQQYRTQYFDAFPSSFVYS